MQKLTKDHLKVMNFPESYIRSTLDQVTDSIYTHVSNFINNRERLLVRGAGLLLSGDVGTGKSAAAAVILKNYRAWGQRYAVGVQGNTHHYPITIIGIVIISLHHYHHHDNDASLQDDSYGLA